MKLKVRKIYFQKNQWTVYLNSHDNIKIDDSLNEKTYDYFKEVYSKESIVPKYVHEKCRELHAMWHDGSIYHWLDTWKKENKKN